MITTNEELLDEYHKLVARLKKRRLQKKLTLKQLAEKTDIPYDTIRVWESGRTVASGPGLYRWMKFLREI